MAQRKKKAARDVEKDYPRAQFVAKLRRLADALEEGRRFQIRIAGERVSIPSTASITLEHERGDGEEEVEFQLAWRLDDAPAGPSARRRPASRRRAKRLR
ncbi:MAG: amphi-Trp domain-containing protein [Deltaproteobacteria bacterium]|nr:amphi-Trp domain-containing protein [Deltaproteobacteria bacterium]